MSGSEPPQLSTATNDQARSYDRERWCVAIIAALGGIISLIWLFWRLKGEAADWNTLAKLAVAVLLALAITAMLRFALAPLGRGRPMPAATSPATPSDPDAAVRRWITPIVFVVGSGAIIVLALGLVIAFTVLAAQPNNDAIAAKIDTLLNGIFGAVLPIFATWVGTVIAFYFTSSNFQQAAKIAREATTTAAPQASVIDRMIPYDKIARLDRPRAEAREALMADVVKLFSPPVTRVIIFDQATKQPVFVIRHKRVPADWLQHPQNHTIDEYLRQTVEGRSNAQDAAQFEFISQTAAIDEARAKMASANCVDLFVTAGGEKTQPTLGWLTDDLVK